MHEIGEFLQHDALAGVPGTLDELHDADLHAMADRAHDHAEGGGGLALALAGMDDEKALLDGLPGDDLVARGLLLAHLLGMASVGFACRSDLSCSSVIASPSR